MKRFLIFQCECPKIAKNKNGLTFIWQDVHIQAEILLGLEVLDSTLWQGKHTLSMTGLYCATFYCDNAIKCMWCTTCVRLVPANWHFLMMLSISKPSLLSILFSIRIFTFNGSILAEKNFVKITNIILKYHPTLYYWKHHSRMQSKHICIIIKKNHE